MLFYSLQSLCFSEPAHSKQIVSRFNLFIIRFDLGNCQRIGFKGASIRSIRTSLHIKMGNVEVLSEREHHTLQVVTLLRKDLLNKIDY